MSIIVSIYYFLLDWFYTAEEFHFCDLVELMLYKRSVPVWLHYTEWFQAAQKHPNNILWVFFEDMVGKREECVKKVAEFIGLSSLDDVEERISIATENSSFEWMKSHDNLFDEAPSKKARNHVFGAVGNKASKIRTGKTTVDTMDPLLRQEIDEILWSQFNDALGVTSYSDFRALVSNSTAQVFQPNI